MKNRFFKKSSPKRVYTNVLARFWWKPHKERVNVGSFSLWRIGLGGDMGSIVSKRVGEAGLQVGFSKIPGKEMSLVRRNWVCLVPRMTGEAQGTAWNGFWSLKPTLKIKKTRKKTKIQEIPPQGPHRSLWVPIGPTVGPSLLSSSAGDTLYFWLWGCRTAQANKFPCGIS